MGEQYSNRFLCRSYNVLLGDEDEERRKKARDVFAAYGISMDEADNAGDVVRLAKDHTFDMVFICEDMIKEDDGRSFAEIAPARENAEESTILVALTQNDNPGEIDHFLREGYQDVLLEPFEKESLSVFLNRWVPEARRRYLEEEESELETDDITVIKLFMSGVDVIDGINKNGGIEEFLDLVDIFYTDGLKRKESLNEKIDSRDILNYTIEVHGLKSAAANVGAKELSEIAKQHEDFGNATDIDSIERKREALFDSYTQVLSEMERVLRSREYGSFAKRTEELPKLERGEMIESMQKILGHLEDFKSKDAAKELEELLEHSLEEEIRTQLQQVQVMLKMYEDDDAEDKLRAMIEAL